MYDIRTINMYDIRTIYDMIISHFYLSMDTRFGSSVIKEGYRTTTTSVPMPDANLIFKNTYMSIVDVLPSINFVEMD